MRRVGRGEGEEGPPADWRFVGLCESGVVSGL